MINHLVMFSGGVCSWAAAKRVIDRHGREGVKLLFADTKIEDEDTYRFLDEASDNVGVELIRIEDGRTPWEVMRDNKFIANTRVDICSRVLKRDLLTKWRDENCSVDQTVVYVGLLWDEDVRVRQVAERYLPWRYESPMADKPWISKEMMLQWLLREGIKPPRMYAMGFAHNNCGGFCVKAGQAHFKRLLDNMPDRYAFHEQKEQELREITGDHAILRDRRGGVTKPMTLKEFRNRIEGNQEYDMFDLGGCGCAVE